MAKVLYTGISSKARKVRKLFIGIDGKARKVKKAYIGVGNKARLFFSSGVQAGLYMFRNRSKIMNMVDKNSYGFLSTITLPATVYFYGSDYPNAYAADGTLGFLDTTRKILTVDPVTGALMVNSGVTFSANMLSSIAGSSYGILKVKTNGYRNFTYDVLDPHTFSVKASVTGALSGRYDESVSVRGTGAGDYFHTVREYEDSDGDSRVKYYRSCMSTGAILYADPSSDYAWMSGIFTDDGTYLYIKNMGNGGAFKYDLNRTTQLINKTFHVDPNDSESSSIGGSFVCVT